MSVGCRVVRYDDISFLAHAIHAAPSVDEFKGKIVFQNDLTPEEDEAFRRVCEDVSTRYPPPPVSLALFSGQDYLPKCGGGGAQA